MTAKLKGVVFDMDGVIIESEHTLRVGNARTHNSCGLVTARSTDHSQILVLPCPELQGFLKL